VYESYPNNRDPLPQYEPIESERSNRAIHAKSKFYNNDAFLEGKSSVRTFDALKYVKSITA